MLLQQVALYRQLFGLRERSGIERQRADQVQRSILKRVRRFQDSSGYGHAYLLVAQNHVTQARSTKDLFQMTSKSASRLGSLRLSGADELIEQVVQFHAWIENLGGSWLCQNDAVTARFYETGQILRRSK